MFVGKIIVDCFKGNGSNHFLLLCESKLENIVNAPPMTNAPVAM